ncbi:hypothetical protein, partial [Oceanobacillus bengalensis]|uniref:hypothetical protein n=1 Tax=Oceanobacillus bengalensis TaxID=1435466 RepID=UPI001C7DD5BB
MKRGKLLVACPFHLSREESIYPEKRAFIPRREHLSREESIYPEKRAFIPRREHLSREESI